MKNYEGFLLIVVVCAIVLLIGAMKKKSELLINFILRTVLGLISIYFINEILKWQSIDVLVGMNPITALTTGMLGFPGVILLYGIQFCKFL
ncbi:MAG: pro-sigmaK processing inhibitor BofA family protein [Lachnospiraceae bacterium]|nr:pro-sigmaK processing inhibitor BofA family protein [Lachnospiraceae bacterium]